LKRKRAPFESEADEARIDRWQRLRKMDSSKQLKRMIGDKAEFRGVQKAAIEAISPVVAVMPTGAGKSLLFMLPAFAEQGGTTIVVVPLIALRDHMKRRCTKLGILYVDWESCRPPDAAAVVLITPESAVGEAFATFLNRLQATRQLDRIVIDKCHIVAVHVPQADAAAGQARSCRDADSHVDSHVAAQRGRRVVPANAF
jgi:superfamily II DNA helicase RecQ